MTLIATIALVLAAACLGYFAGAARVQVVKAQRDALADAMARLAGLPPRSRRTRDRARVSFRAHEMRMEDRT
jgi:hypothetical protein